MSIREFHSLRAKLRTLAGAHTLSSSSMTASGDPEMGWDEVGRTGGKLDAMIQEYTSIEL
jgi:hypothetical protein